MTDIQVGDTVRIKNLEAFMYGEGNEKGVEFVVTEVRGGSGFNPDLGDYYVNGDPAGRGMWVKFVEKVNPIPARWRYNDHIVVYAGTRDTHNGYSESLGRGVTVLTETPLPKVYTRWENSVDRMADEVTEAALPVIDLLALKASEAS